MPLLQSGGRKFESYIWYYDFLVSNNFLTFAYGNSKTRRLIYTINNIRERSIQDNPVKYSKVIGGKKWRTHKLENSFDVILTNDVRLEFKKGFLWDRSSVPQIFWGVLRPDGDDDIAYLIHDLLYVNKGWRDKRRMGGGARMTRKFCDDEMLRWAKEMKGTNRWSLRNIDIYIRYYAVRWFGGFVWNKK